MGCLEATKAQVSWRHQGVVHGGVGMSSSPQKLMILTSKMRLEWDFT
jgi:hypothetical protein